jgi:hypothetical protein
MSVCLRFTISGLFLFSVLSFGLSLQAQDDESAAKSTKQTPDQLQNDMRWWVERQSTMIKNFGKKDSDCFLCALTGQGDNQPHTCEKNYRRFYSQRTRDDGAPWKSPEDGRAYIDAHLTFGYADFGDEVDDIYTREAFINEIKTDCKLVPGIAACGFKKIDPDDADLYYKDIDGPTGPVTIRIDIKNSSATPSEAKNRTLGLDGKVAMTPEQAAKTEAAENSWFGGLAGEAALDIYVGHNRGGGGPGMRPPNVNPKTRTTDYDAYRKNPESLNRAVSILKSNKTNPPAIVAVFACYSENYESAAFQAASPKTAFIFSGDSAQGADLAHVFSLFDDILATRCEADVKMSFDSLEKLPYDHIGPTFIHGLFP